MATMTAAQKRAQAKAEYDAFLAACPSRKLLDRISDKWVTLSLAALGADVTGVDISDEAVRFATTLSAESGIPATVDAEPIRRLRAAGAIPVGITNVPELMIFPWTATAANGITPDATQLFTLTVNETPAITSPVAPSLLTRPALCGDPSHGDTTSQPRNASAAPSAAINWSRRGAS